MILDTVAKRIEVLLAGAVTVNELHCYAAYADHTSTTFSPGSSDTLTAGATAVTVVAAPPVNTKRQVKMLGVFNADTASATVTVRINTTAAARTLMKVTLASGEHLVWDPGNGWQVITTSGAVKSGVGVAGNTGDVQFNAGGGLLGANANLNWDNTNNKLRLGDGSASHPSYTFVNSATTGLFRQAADIIGIATAGTERIRIDAAAMYMGVLTTLPTINGFATLKNDAAAHLFAGAAGSDAGTSRPILFFRRARTSLASPGAVSANDSLGEMVMQAHDGTSYGEAFEFLLEAGEAWTGSAHGSRVSFKRPRNGQTTRDIALQLGEVVADTETAILIQRNVGGTLTLQRVTMGATDSGGAGFKLLRVPN